MDFNLNLLTAVCMDEMITQLYRLTLTIQLLSRKLRQLSLSCCDADDLSLSHGPFNESPNFQVRCYHDGSIFCTAWTL